MPSISFDALGLWISLSDLREDQTGEVILPVAWPQIHRRRFSTVETAPAEAANGTLTVQGIQSVQRPADDNGWEPLSVWTRDPNGITLIGNTEVRFVGAHLEATLTLRDRPNAA